MKIPWSKRKKALLIIDVQPGFLNKRNRQIISRIKRLIGKASYDLYVDAVFNAEKKSIWDKQTNWTLPQGRLTKTVGELIKSLQAKKWLSIKKQTKSAFKGVPSLQAVLKKNKITEVHIVGLDTNDCILATAYEAFDLGYFTYVLEECTESSANLATHTAAVKILRHVNLTNNSCVEKIDFVRL